MDGSNLEMEELYLACTAVPRVVAAPPAEVAPTGTLDVPHPMQADMGLRSASKRLAAPVPRY
jgi:hypothetical protein